MTLEIKTGKAIAVEVELYEKIPMTTMEILPSKKWTSNESLKMWKVDFMNFIYNKFYKLNLSTDDINKIKNKIKELGK